MRGTAMCSGLACGRRIRERLRFTKKGLSKGWSVRLFSLGSDLQHDFVMALTIAELVAAFCFFFPFKHPEL